MCHIFIKFADFLGLGCKEVVVFQQFSDLDQEIAVHKINLIVCLFGFLPQILCISL